MIQKDTDIILWINVIYTNKTHWQTLKLKSTGKLSTLNHTRTTGQVLTVADKLLNYLLNKGSSD